MHSSWAKKASSLPSDRIKPSNAKSQQVSSKVKGKQPVREPPKSKEIWRLELLLDSVQNLVGKKDPKAGCFCLAREHPYVFPAALYSAPSIFHNTPVLPVSNPYGHTPSAARITKEIEDAERAAEEAKKAAGAFPVLSLSGPIPSFPSPSPSPVPTPPNNKPSSYKVMSLTQKKKNNKVVVSSYTSTPQPPPSSAER
ncbi:uncharacterized protein LACBIDRAFT_332064 [Laccaria bicolor S238N-H82]|uniref:Predicted protein n=1 Tax=Laccaria bicolor (strain S238N-H82 / ATCC MYA-4686) TaxID=486041 RepID=B0DRG4_LACBS|nr:uncharacterized protein LACBIDRAFT_332064 [Laccaria bicolor S238N-H82]EDR02778.1 predicted protein [Laccaria bicolor S238N-H82]|eukprot:XP_001886488.1 predicted protein [Laccaria bicolor S238N-H82]